MAGPNDDGLKPQQPPPSPDFAVEAEKVTPELERARTDAILREQNRVVQQTVRAAAKQNLPALQTPYLQELNRAAAKAIARADRTGAYRAVEKSRDPPDGRG